MKFAYDRGVPQQGRSASDYGSDDDVFARLRASVQDAHLQLLVGAGTPSALFAPLGDVELALTELASKPRARGAHLARASIQALFFERVIWPNVELVRNPGPKADEVLRSYRTLGRTLNRLLLHRRSTILPKRVNLITTNVDLAFEVAFEGLGIDLNDGFTGRFRPTFDAGSFGTVQFRLSPRFGNRFEVPAFDLIKLHGSVGWRWDPVDGQAPEIGFDPLLTDLELVKESLEAVRSGLVELEDPKQIEVQAIVGKAGRKRAPAGLDEFIRRYDELVIVHPEKTKFAKTVMTETYYELIRLFANELERENSLLLVLGFSFRDEHLRKIVLRAARSNPTLQVYVVCFTPADEAWYRSLMPDHLVPNGNIEYLIPPDDTTKFDLNEVIERFLLPLLDPESQDELRTQR